MKRIELLFDSNRGVYIPRDFTDMTNWVYREEYRETLKNPTNEDYWSTWDMVLDDAQCIDSAGYKWILHQDGDLWAIRSDLFDDTESKEYRDFFGYEE